MAKNGNIVVICKYCGKETFSTQQKIDNNKSGNFFCDRNCKNLFDSENKMTATCLQCGKTFNVINSQIENGRGKFCSKSCCNIFSKNNAKIGDSNPLFTGIKTTCRQCGKTLFVRQSIWNEGRGRFCSRKCFAEWRSINLSGVNSKMYKGYHAKCAHCGKEMSIRPSHAKKFILHFCNRDCQIAWSIENLSGENSNWWRGGITHENRAARTSCEMLNWKKAVYKRDKYSCQHCGKKYTELHAHHIIPFSCDKSLRTELSNGITLCKLCHKKEHERLRKLINENYDLFIV